MKKEMTFQDVKNTLVWSIPIIISNQYFSLHGTSENLQAFKKKNIVEEFQNAMAIYHLKLFLENIIAKMIL